MELLSPCRLAARKAASFGLIGTLSLGLVLSGCADEITEIRYLETDTFISSASDRNNSESPRLYLYNDGVTEERVLARLPTAEDDPWDGEIDSFDEFILTFFLMPIEVLAGLLTCNTDSLDASDLTSATLIFDADGVAPVTGDVQLELLEKPWWQTVSWTTAHPFSSRGTWDTPGGDVDPSFTPITNVTSGTEVQFPITNYFRDLISADGELEHYGFLIRSVDATLAQVALQSVQGSSSTTRPRLKAVYNGSCPNFDASLSLHSGLRPNHRRSSREIVAHRRTTIFGKRPIIIDEPIYADELN